MKLLLIAFYLFLLADLVDRVVTYYGLRLGHEEANTLVGNDRFSWVKSYLIIILLIELVSVVYIVNEVLALWFLGFLVGGKVVAIQGSLRVIEDSKEVIKSRLYAPKTVP